MNGHAFRDDIIGYDSSPLFISGEMRQALKCDAVNMEHDGHDIGERRARLRYDDEWREMVARLCIT